MCEDKKREFKIPKNSLVVLVGVPSSGKTALAKSILKKNGVIVSAGKIRQNMIVSSNTSDEEKEKMVFEEYYRKIDNNLKSGKLVIADASSINPGGREKLYFLANKNKRPIRILIMNISLETVLKMNRLKNNINEEFIKDMYDKMKKTYDLIEREVQDLRKNGRDIKVCDIIHLEKNEEKTSSSTNNLDYS